MAKFTATVEQANDGNWTAALIGEHMILGAGATKEEAIQSLRQGILGELSYGKSLPQSSVELISIEVAA